MSPAGPASRAGMVLADTCIWIAAEQDAAVAARLTELIRNDRLAMCGVVYAEILRGIRSPLLREERAHKLLALQWLETPAGAWQKTADLAANQDRAGHPIPLTDAHVAALCTIHHLTLWTNDRHYDHMRALQRFPG